MLCLVSFQQILCELLMISITVLSSSFGPAKERMRTQNQPSQSAIVGTKLCDISFNNGIRPKQYSDTIFDIFIWAPCILQTCLAFECAIIIFCLIMYLLMFNYPLNCIRDSCVNLFYLALSLATLRTVFYDLTIFVCCQLPSTEKKDHINIRFSRVLFSIVPHALLNLSLPMR